MARAFRRASRGRQVPDARLFAECGGNDSFIPQVRPDLARLAERKRDLTPNPSGDNQVVRELDFGCVLDAKDVAAAEVEHVIRARLAPECERIVRRSKSK